MLDSSTVQILEVILSSQICSPAPLPDAAPVAGLIPVEPTRTNLPNGVGAPLARIESETKGKNHVSTAVISTKHTGIWEIVGKNDLKIREMNLVQREGGKGHCTGSTHLSPTKPRNLRYSIASLKHSRSYHGREIFVERGRRRIVKGKRLGGG